MLRRIIRFFSIAGPGVITGAADDDPSGIATYSQTGAQFGYGQLWTMLFMLPMMIAIQEMCARIGLTKGKGIAGVIKDHYPKPVLYILIGLMSIANIINLGTDLGAMAAATRLLVPVPFFAVAIFFSVVSVLLESYSSYRVYSRYLKWLSVSLFAYVLTAFVVPQNWGEVLKSTFVPHVELNYQFLMILVGLLGTTISPYLFFWQASQEVEESRQPDQMPERIAETTDSGPSAASERGRMRAARLDTLTGMTFSQTAAWFVIITAAGSLHAAGQTDVATAADAAKALQPLVTSFPYAGQIASAIFAVGIIGLGLLAVPVFAGTTAYALSETFGWTYGLSMKPKNAPYFYAVIAISTFGGIAVDLVHISPMKALIYTAVINGIIAVPLILFILLIAGSKAIMGDYTNGKWSTIVGWVTFTVMAAAATAMIISFFI